MKGVGKADADNYSAQMSNFSKIYANVEGCSVADGSKYGGLFLRSVCKVFKDIKFLNKNDWSKMIFKIREYTKRDATIDGTLFNFTQLVEDEGTMERPVWFHKRPEYLDIVHEEEEDEDNYALNVLITNLSKTDDIAVLVEDDESGDNRDELIKSLLKVNVNVNVNVNVHVIVNFKF